jgi:hypothetical protein
MRARRRRVPRADEAQHDLAPGAARSGLYIAHDTSASVAERLWPWILVTVSILASLAAMAR